MSEATVILLDTSSHMRNSDYPPTRQLSQRDAITLLFQAKTAQNPESVNALMTMTKGKTEVLVSFTNEIGRVLTAEHAIQVGGRLSLTEGISVAQLALKHRQNKKQRQRVVVFVGSPIEEDEAALIRLGKKLKKNNVALDIINFGEFEDNVARLEAFLGSVQNGDTCHMISVPPGGNTISDSLLSSPIVAGEDGAQPSGFGNFEFGIDPELDPELAMALRISLDEEKNRQTEGQSGTAVPLPAAAAAPPPANKSPAKSPAKPAANEDTEMAAAMALSLEKEDDELARAIAMSMDVDEKPASPAKGSSPKKK